MNTITSALLGAIQGLTEFLPVSSSGHLVLFQNLLGYKEPELLLDTTLHLGTLTAVFIYFYSDLKKIASDTIKLDGKSPNVNLLIWILVASIPTGLIGLIFRHPLEALFHDSYKVGIMLITTGFILLTTRLIRFAKKASLTVGLLPALAIGIAQGIAIIPGISRSGITIACALIIGLERELAGRFSFLLSIPAIIGAALLQLKGEEIARVGIASLGAGFLAAALVGLLALKLLMGMVRQGRLHYFAPYCWLAGIVTIATS
ncbi:MAG: hypothetical protein COZ70_06155 [Deltaproteobacteria bacterium CG_4_8_14_3_um_filter_51_11]|nr:undecaprenyl-diphosphate phosphatase [bacterium]OIP37711.1 MAG: hypothetical protein AUK25_14295 [Desulfobacteraceae bacterium CG2_30_51_40]PIP45710.1 MAG: hypothetical protein COX16_11785 [Deltaproteobacteria bacterium CG23_combo_of_CG06-09_8_20_14_all_51_20]PIV99726.1 MAG: hypothetical protein COW41_07195 [Deltaproteobacteria bacterium CG17_big_fil_post_rev_8_21_14_2_50_51_6]PIX19980.1 MAG: hypothetical protein COZ70_06155 [Deltaproteobacteria bacterium CG_4_8_14_3_um_filter_51_11]PIY2362